MHLNPLSCLSIKYCKHPLISMGQRANSSASKAPKSTICSCIYTPKKILQNDFMHVRGGRHKHKLNTKILRVYP